MPFGMPKTEDMTDQDLMERMDRSDLNSGVADYCMAELTRRAIVKTNENTERLKNSIDQFSKSSDGYSKKIVWLTWVLVILTVLSLIALFIKK